MSLSNRATIESGLLCAALCGDHVVAEIQATAGDHPFRDPDRRAYWEILTRRAEVGEPFDIDTMMDELTRRRCNLQVLVDLTALQFEVTHVGYYCGELRKLNEIDDARSLGAKLLKDTEPDVDDYIAKRIGGDRFVAVTEYTLPRLAAEFSRVKDEVGNEPF